MNDEDFARSTITRAFPGGNEPALGLGVDQLVRDGRRAARRRGAGLATGGTALAGAVALTAWGLVGQEPSTSSVPAGSGQSVQKPPLADSKAGLSSCSTTVDLAAVLRDALPSGSTIASATATTCTLKRVGQRSVDVMVQLAGGVGSLAVGVDSGGTAGAEPSVDPKDAAAKASIAAADGDKLPTCTDADNGWRVCVSHKTRSGTQLSLVDLSNASSRREVTVEAGGPETGGAAPFADTTLLTLARDLASRTS